MPVRKTGSGAEAPRRGARCRTSLDVDAPGGGVDQGYAVEEKGRAEGAEEEILEGRFNGPQAPFQEPAEDVDGEGHHLQPDEDRDEAVRRDHRHHAEDGEEQERVVLARDDLLAPRIAEGDEGDQEEDQRGICT